MIKNILVTGSSKNLGKFISDSFAKEGHNVFGFSRFNKKNSIFFDYKCDLLNTSNIKKKLFTIKKKYRKLDCLILCAGDSKKYYKKIESYSYWLKSFNSNFFSCTNFIESYLDVFKNKPTKILVISSIAGKKITNAPITYSVAKASLNFYSKYKAKELAKHNITLNVLSPGNILMKNNNWDKKIIKNKKKILEYIKKNVPLNKFCSATEIFEFCKYLVFRANRVTGSNFTIDGGESI
jgi:3-oxoacyl-[acyl-carrier protein] reductase